MSMRVVDNKKLDMTDGEYAEFEKICKTSDRPNFKGEELFRDRFVSDEQGRIVYLRALGNKFVNFESVFFLMNLMQNQHLRTMYNEINVIAKKMNDKIESITQKEKLLDEKLYQMKSVE